MFDDDDNEQDDLAGKVYCAAECMEWRDYLEDKPEDVQGIAADISILELYGGGFLIQALENIVARLGL